MKKINKILLRVLCVLCLAAFLTASIFALYEPDQSEADFAEAEEEKSEESPEMHPFASESGTEQETSAMTFSDQLVDFIIQFEGFEPYRYWDVTRWSIGYGSDYDKAVEMFPSIAEDGELTEEQAAEILMEDLQDFSDWLNDILASDGIVLNQNQFDALISLTYSIGSQWWTYQDEDGSWSELRKMLEDDPSTWTEERVRAAFGSWRMAGGEVLPGLELRRSKEAELFLTPWSDSVFVDVPEDEWYYDYVMAAYDAGIMQGYGNGRFGPEDRLTRGEMVQALANFSGADLSIYEGQTGGFPDVAEDAWYAPAVAWAAENGFVNGYDNGNFGPEDEIERQHLCSIAARYLRTWGIAPDDEGESAAAFLDDAEMQDTSREDIYYCAALGIVEGIGDGNFNPQEPATRGELAKILTGMLAVTDESTEAA